MRTDSKPPCSSQIELLVLLPAHLPAKPRFAALFRDPFLIDLSARVLVVELGAVRRRRCGAVPRARPPLISGFIFAASKATSGVVDGATAPTQLSTLSAASRHLKSGMLIICVDHVGFGLYSVRFCGLV